MRSPCFALAALIAIPFYTSAQERLSRPEALKYAFFTCLDLKELTGTPIPTDPDPKRPVAIRHGDHGLLLLPECKLNAGSISNASNVAIPIGQLWLVKIAPLVGNQAVPASKLRMVEIKADAGQGTAACCALAVRKSSEGGLELWVYGKALNGLFTVPMKAVSGEFDPETPLDAMVDVEGDSAKLTLKLLGKYEAVFPVGRAIE
jgi:hypothetical protein